MGVATPHPMLADVRFLRIAALRLKKRKQEWIQRARERLPSPHAKQRLFLDSPAKRKIIKAGRRGGKTVGMAIDAVNAFLSGHRVLYAVPTQDQMDRFWTTCKQALQEPINAGVFRKNETLHLIELPGTEQRIRAKTAWNADTLRGDYCTKLILDEYQLMSEDAWELVGAPMMLDKNGDAVFIFTPPSLHSRSVSKAKDKRHAAKLFKRAQADTTGRWEAFHFTSHDNPYLDREALEDITQDMTQLAIKQEILAQDNEEDPNALWNYALLEQCRVLKHPKLKRIVVGVDPHASVGQTGIVVTGLGVDDHGYVLEDATTGGSPATWAGQAVAMYHKYSADRIVVEANNGGDMCISTLQTIDRAVATKKVWASRGKATRAEPVVAKYERGLIHHVGVLADLEEEQVNYVPGDPGESPNRMDALCWSAHELMLLSERAGTWGR